MAGMLAPAADAVAVAADRGRRGQRPAVRDRDAAIVQKALQGLHAGVRGPDRGDAFRSAAEAAGQQCTGIVAGGQLRRGCSLR